MKSGEYSGRIEEKLTKKFYIAMIYLIRKKSWKQFRFQKMWNIETSLPIKWNIYNENHKMLQTRKKTWEIEWGTQKLRTPMAFVGDPDLVSGVHMRLNSNSSHEKLSVTLAPGDSAPSDH